MYDVNKNNKTNLFFIIWKLLYFIFYDTDHNHCITHNVWLMTMSYVECVCKKNLRICTNDYDKIIKIAIWNISKSCGSMSCAVMSKMCLSLLFVWDLYEETHKKRWIKWVVVDALQLLIKLMSCVLEVFFLFLIFRNNY